MMKIALYITDGLEQIVLTPETDMEKSILGSLRKGDRDMSIVTGQFYECQGGWLREGRGPDSTMIVLRPKPAPAPELPLSGDEE